jgi:hypothetical protein
LQEFVEPLADSTADYDAYKRLIQMGVVAWNAALEPERGDRDAFIGAAIDESMADASLWERLACRAQIDKLVARKLQQFAGYHRPILAFHLEEVEDGGLHLSVASGIC